MRPTSMCDGIPVAIDKSMNASDGVQSFSYHAVQDTPVDLMALIPVASRARSTAQDFIEHDGRRVG